MVVSAATERDVAVIAALVGCSFLAEHPLALGCRADYGAEVRPGRFVFVELEVGQKHPQTNVLKHWPWLDEHADHRALLIQLFYGNWSRRRLTDWTAARLGIVTDGHLGYLGVETPLQDEAIRSILDRIGALGV